MNIDDLIEHTWLGLWDCLPNEMEDRIESFLQALIPMPKAKEESTKLIDGLRKQYAVTMDFKPNTQDELTNTFASALHREKTFIWYQEAILLGAQKILNKHRLLRPIFRKDWDGK